MTRPASHTFSILDLDATALAAQLRDGTLGCHDVTAAYLERLVALNPRLHAVITVNPEAERVAAALDELPAAARGPLHGVPLLIKDNIDVAGLPTTAGSVLLRGHVPHEDAPIVARLRAAGAVILGKANMTEWANFMTLGMRNGYSSLGGATVNPWSPVLDTGGSSSGSGVAVAARLCAAAIGTETSGSIVSPAHQNGCFGLKPTLGLVPRTGVVPISHSQDTAGPITRSARDAALLMSVIAGPDERDPVTLDAQAPDFGTLNLPAPLRVAVVCGESGVSARDEEALNLAQKHLGTLGAQLQDEVLACRAEMQASGWMLDVLVYEFKGALNAYLSGVQHGPRTLEAVIAQNDENPTERLRYGQTLLHAAQGTRGDDSERAYHAARARDLRLSREGGFDPLLARHDVILLPGIHGCDLAAKAGYPSLSVPLPAPDGGQPGGVLLVAGPGADATLLAVAERLQEVAGAIAYPALN
ncbi:amidase family protein [Deinococcus taklimakanensis]|uniref:Amidase family protein n=1 Tax=Deinococcus taklimakanensis TaxID=536443 RepID=A0ABW5P2Z5_9DEIO